MGKHNGRVRKTGLAVGKSLENISRQSRSSRPQSNRLEDADPSMQQQSILDQDDLEDLMTMAELAGRDFAAERQKVVVLDSHLASNNNQSISSEDIKSAQLRCAEFVRIPRRPHWTTEETPEELDRIEKNAFLQWRRQLAQITEQEPSITLTPYEKNLEVWRQLWRVLERSQILVQVVDARDPLLYWSQDLVDYIHELDTKRRSFLLLNKADLLSDEMRQSWSEYFEERGMSFAFWSAKNANEEIDQIQNSNNSSIHIQSVNQVIDLLSNLLEKSEDQDHVTVGLVGYPNVGKSSTINALFGRKKTPVGATPGRTKHFQTLIINNNLTLCDCPGLVLPGFAASKAQMVAAGVIPIDKLVDLISPVLVILSKVGIQQFGRVYGLKMSDEMGMSEKGAVEAISLLALSRGWTQASGRPDQTKAGRLIIKDFINGKLLHCEPPPGVQPTPSMDQTIIKDEHEESKDSLVVDMGPGDDDLLRELVMEEEREIRSKPRRAEHKFQKKPPRRKGNRGRQYNNEAPATSTAFVKGYRGTLTNSIYSKSTSMSQPSN